MECTPDDYKQFAQMRDNWLLVQFQNDSVVEATSVPLPLKSRMFWKIGTTDGWIKQLFCSEDKASSLCDTG